MVDIGCDAVLKLVVGVVRESDIADCRLEDETQRWRPSLQQCCTKAKSRKWFVDLILLTPGCRTGTKDELLDVMSESMLHLKPDVLIAHAG